jgi:hypothetical protein
LTLGAGALAAANPPIDAARLDVVPAGLRGRGEAGRKALRGVLQGGAPLLFGAISDLFGGGTAGLKWTFLIIPIKKKLLSDLANPMKSWTAAEDARSLHLFRADGWRCSADRPRVGSGGGGAGASPLGI